MQEPAPPAAELCYRLKKTKPPTRRTSDIVHIKPRPPFRTSETALSKKQGRMLIGDNHKILQTFIMSIILFKFKRGYSSPQHQRYIMITLYQNLLLFSCRDNVQNFSHIFFGLARSSSPLPEIRSSWEAFAHPRSGCLLLFLVTKNSVRS